MKKPIISTLQEKPKTKVAWWALYLGIATIFIPFLLGMFTSFIRPILDQASVNPENIGIGVGFGGGILSLALSISALVAGIIAFRKGERSWVPVTGFVLAAIVCVFWVVMIIGEFVFPH